MILSNYTICDSDHQYKKKRQVKWQACRWKVPTMSSHVKMSVSNRRLIFTDFTIFQKKTILLRSNTWKEDLFSGPFYTNTFSNHSVFISLHFQIDPLWIACSHVCVFMIISVWTGGETVTILFRFQMKTYLCNRGLKLWKSIFLTK